MTDTSAPSTVPRYDVRSVAAGGLCIGSLFVGPWGWPAAIVGVVLLRRAALPAKVKWGLAAVAILPKILFLGVRAATAPQGLSFKIEPVTLATSSSLWAWSVLLAAFGGFLLVKSRPAPPPPGAPPPPQTRQPLLLRLLGLAAVAGAVVLLLGLTDGFHSIDEAGDGRWALRHAGRGTRATFTRADLASIEARENHRSRGPTTYTIRVALRDGRTYSVTTGDSSAIEEVRAFATTADLGPGTLRIARYGRGTWTNGATGYRLKDYLGTFEHVDTKTGERTALEFWMDGGRLAGRQTVVNGATRFVRTMRRLRVSDTGELAFDLATRAEVGKPSESTMSFSFSSSLSDETARLTDEGLQVGVMKLARR